MEPLEEILKKMDAPLTFASRDVQHLSRLKGFEATMKGLTDQLKAGIEASKPGSSSLHLISELEAMFSGFDHEMLEVRAARVEKAVRILQEIKAALSLSRDHAEIEQDRKRARTDRDLKKDFEKLSTPVQYIRGVGPKIAVLLERKGIRTVEDMIYFLPRCYEDRRSIAGIASAVVGRRETIIAEIVRADVRPYARRRVFELTVTDGEGMLAAVWFKGSLAYLKKQFQPGQRVILSGEIRGYQHGKSMVHPDYEVLDQGDGDMLHFKRIIPVYSETEGLRRKTIRRIMMRVVEDYASSVPSPLPDDICGRRHLMDTHEAVRNVHFPPQEGAIEKYNAYRSDAHQRLIYDEFFFLQLGMALKRKGFQVDEGIAFHLHGKRLKTFYEMLPFRLTGAQQRVVSEIEADMAKPFSMNRLLQGDVGSGKTIVAMASMITACDNGFQAAIMAPTEILARQHHNNIRKWADALGLNVALLTGSSAAGAKAETQEKIANGQIHIVVGTHALIQQQVVFHNLGLAVVDEQHRFGVLQRASLRGKGRHPDILVMTATPIPRTLAMTVYGDLDVSVIDEMPPGKKPIRTKVFYEQHRQKVYNLIRQELVKGNQVFVVYPLVEESETLDLKDATNMAEQLQKDVFPEYRIGLIHGRMKSRQKDDVMSAFVNRALDILVSTTVIEVGIDIPQASLMVVEHAERFGLSQLHQLRGRVGRSDIASYCVLLAQHKGSEDARKRLRIMEATNDGFLIAEEDLVIRGPGEFMGIRQSGLPDFRVASIVRDARILNEARTDAFTVIEEDPMLEKEKNRALREVLMRRWEGRLELARIG